MASQEGTDQIPMSAMSKPRCRLQDLPGQTTGKCLWARRLLLLLCLGWLWGATPVAAQDAASPPATEATGPYRNLAENHAGTFHLTREEGVVYATFSTDRSPVQFLARDQPEVLFTVPEGFQPVLPVTWEVSAEPVLPDGAPHPDRTARHVFRMRVDREGHVRYVDDAGVDGVGHLRYHTMLAWPLAGTEPRVCDRYWRIREGLLAAVQTLEDIPVPCTQVDWTHLARIRNLSLHARDWGMDFARHDLLGLTNLAALQVSAPRATYPAELLAHTPRLQTLRMAETTLEELPADLFRYTPRLTHLSLEDDTRQETDPPVNLLVHTPHLESLLLEGRHPAAALVPLLAHTPRLTHLTVMSSTPLPETFLATVPRLTHLTIKRGFEPCATPELLAPVPRLRHIAVRMAAAERELACLDRALRLHTPILAELHAELGGLQGLETGVLPHLPRLTRLTLAVGDRQPPAQLLAEAPELTHLALHGGALRLPDGFLAHTPRLTDLSLQVSRLNDLPPDLLAPVPDLRRLQLVTRDATTLPEWFLDQVTEMRMAVGQLADLPADFLMHAPHLEVLYLDVHSQKSFPEHFLTYAPRLVELHLDVPSLRALPPSFLAHAPRLEVFHLDTGYSWRLKDEGDTPSVLRSFPKNFLTHTPQLVELYLRVPALEALPSSFLGHAPRLETLELIGTHDYYGEDELPIRSLPTNFLIHAPRLRHLDLGALGYVEAFPPGFLAHAPQLRYLNLDATDAASLPPEFLTRHPRLEMVRLQAKHVPVLPPGFLSQSPNLIDLRLDLQQVDVLPEGFLAETSRLWNLEIDVHGVEALPPGFLADAPYLAYLHLRALNLKAWPADFLAHAPRLRTLGLAMPHLEPTLTPGHRLWDTLQTASYRVKVTRPDPFHFMESIPTGECWGPHVQLGSILTVEGREQDNNGHTLLRVRHWQDHELFAILAQPMCPFLIDVRHTTPTLEVCDTFRAPETCITYGARDLYQSYRWNFVEP